MKVSLLQENFAKGLSAVLPAISTRTSLPVLTNVALDTDGGRVRLRATDLDIAIVAYICAKVYEDGGLTIPAKLINELVKNLPNDKITLTTNDTAQSLTLQSARNTSTIKGIALDDFPLLPEDHEPIFSMSGKVFADIISRVEAAAATDETRPILQGILVRQGSSTLTFAATDGYRLSVVEIERRSEDEWEYILPAKALAVVKKTIDGDEDIHVSSTPDGNHICFDLQNGITIMTRRIDGRFPDFYRIIPSYHTTRVRFEKKEAMASVKRGAIWTRASGHILKLIIRPPEEGVELLGSVLFTANASEVGECEEVLSCGYEKGEREGVIALNNPYLMQALESIETDDVIMEINESTTPAVFRPSGGSYSHIHLVMPMSVRE